MPNKSSSSQEAIIAVFIDLENLALGLRDKKKVFDIGKILERLVEKGNVVTKKAYSDWRRYTNYKDAFHELAIELIEIPRRGRTGKNSADIKMVVDAMDLCYSKDHVNTFVLVTGDSDFSPLVSKLRENNKFVIGLGMKESTSDLLANNCDEFIFYEDLVRPKVQPPRLGDKLPKKTREAFSLLIDSITALVRENKEVLYSSMVKDTMKRKRPSFNESYHGYGSFSDLLEDAEKNELIKLRTDPRSGTYVVVGFGNKKK